MPPSWLRRPVSITSWLVLSSLLLLLSPLLLAGAEAVAVVDRDRRAPIMTRIILAYFARELSTLIGCGCLWLLSGCGWLMRADWVQGLHWRLLRWFVGGIATSVRRQLHITVIEEQSEPAAELLRGDGPVLIFSRHAGPADTILLIDRLLGHFDRRPSVVFKEAITLDPSVDLISHRLPHAILDVDDREECEVRIRDTAGALGRRGALLLFPEGGNFTPERRRAVLSSLRRREGRRAAERAETMRHVLPPRPSGARAALRANPDAIVVFAAHTGLGLAAYPLEIWRDIPLERELHTRMWVVPRRDVPEGEAEQLAWLTEWWQRVDAWIDAHGETA
jgi:1-acyl-sn-glycerol-3-phosphate acyltransferase